MLTTVVFPLSVMVVSASNASIQRSPSKYCLFVQFFFVHGGGGSTPNVKPITGVNRRVSRNKHHNFSSHARFEVLHSTNQQSHAYVERLPSRSKTPRLILTRRKRKVERFLIPATGHETCHTKRDSVPGASIAMPMPTRRPSDRGVYRHRSKTSGTRLDFDEARFGVEHGQRHLEPQEIGFDPVEFEHDLASVVHLKRRRKREKERERDREREDRR